MTDPIELLRAHDPERGGTPAPPIAPLLARLDDQPPPSRSRALRRRGRRPVAAVVALTSLVLVAAVFAVAGIDGGANGPGRGAGHAPAAADDLIVHIRYRSWWEQPSGKRFGARMQDRGRSIGLGDGPVDRWSADMPPRWRALTVLRASRGMPGGTTEEVHAGGVTRRRYSWRAGTTQVPDLDGPSDGEIGRALRRGTADPRGVVRRMLASGEARRAGTVVRGGRRLVRLVAETPSRRARDGFVMAGARSTYLLDADTYEPVEISSEPVARGRRAGPVIRTVFDVYELLPLTPASERLLQFGG